MTININDSQHNWTLTIAMLCIMLSVIMLNVSFDLLFGWVSLCWVLLCWMSLCWVSWRLLIQSNKHKFFPKFKRSSVCAFFSSFSGCWTINNCNFSANKCWATQLGPLQPPGSRKCQLIYPDCSFCLSVPSCTWVQNGAATLSITTFSITTCSIINLFETLSIMDT